MYLALFSTAAGPDLAQNQVGLQAIRQLVQHLQAGLLCLDSLLITPERLDQSHPQVGTGRLLGQEGAELGDGTREEVPAHIEPGQRPTGQLDTGRFHPIAPPVETAELAGDGLVIGVHLKSALHMPDCLL